MQGVIAIPELAVFEPACKLEELWLRPVCGVPLLTRVLATAIKAGVDSLLVICPFQVSADAREQVLRSRLLHAVPATIVGSAVEFDPRIGSNWDALIDQHLSPEFIWIPWNFVTTKQYLKQLPRVPMSAADWNEPVHVDRNASLGSTPSLDLGSASVPGIAVTSPEKFISAERFLVAHSGKSLDGIHTSFNRRICRPVVRWLSHTSVSPNHVSFAGLLVAIASCWAFTYGSYWWYVLGALLFYGAGLFDEMDGMLARIKFADSPFGCWLEGSIDGLSYLLLFGGITAGLFRQYGRSQLHVGALLLVGTILSLIVTSLQRKRATPPDRPNEYLGRFYHRLEGDSPHWISRFARQVQPFMKRGVLIHYVVVFSILNGLRVFFYVSAIGSHLTWVLALYFNHRFFRTPYRPTISHPRKV